MASSADHSEPNLPISVKEIPPWFLDCLVSLALLHPSTHSVSCLVGGKLEAVSPHDLPAIWKDRKLPRAPLALVFAHTCVCACPQGPSCSVSTVQSWCLLWWTVCSFYLRSDLRHDCPLEGLVEGNSGKNKYSKGWIQDPKVLKYTKEPEMCS